MPTRQGSIRLCRIWGIDLYLHWAWFILALVEIQWRRQMYQSLVFNVLEFLAFFGIVVLHEMGHALACRSVGGKADEIVLWPLGGVAYVAPPQRPGAVLWSIAAGPLVNVVLFGVFIPLVVVARAYGWEETSPNVVQLAWTLLYSNLVLLCFNLLPIYPLDGGQILRALLWFAVGRGTSLLVASIVGFFGVGAIFLFALWRRDWWFGVIGFFILANCWRGLQQARFLGKLERLPRRTGFRCPSCHAAPPVGAFWVCGRCGKAFDTFESMAVCPNCGTSYDTTRCVDCGESHPISAWLVPPPPV
jgi:Zn-dependent protease